MFRTIAATIATVLALGLGTSAAAASGPFDCEPFNCHTPPPPETCEPFCPPLPTCEPFQPCEFGVPTAPVVQTAKAKRVSVKSFGAKAVKAKKGKVQRQVTRLNAG